MQNESFQVSDDETTQLTANFNDKVHKPQSRSYGRIGANMQLFYTYLINLNTSISASRLIWGMRDSMGPIWMH